MALQGIDVELPAVQWRPTSNPITLALTLILTLTLTLTLTPTPTLTPSAQGFYSGAFECLPDSPLPEAEFSPAARAAAGRYGSQVSVVGSMHAHAHVTCTCTCYMHMHMLPCTPMHLPCTYHASACRR